MDFTKLNLNSSIENYNDQYNSDLNKDLMDIFRQQNKVYGIKNEVD